MLGLGAYDSSSEDEVEIKLPTKEKQDLKAPQVESSQIREDGSQPIPNSPPAASETVLDREPSGPVLGPAHGASDGQSIPRNLVHDLTLPPVPNLDIPPSPPGSPNPSANTKFAHFLTLKKQDIHFNEKLAGSVSLKNPSLLKKLMEHAGIDEEAQYSSSLSPDIYNISSLPSWGYKEDLLIAHKEITAKADEKRAKIQRDAIDFVNSGSSRPASALFPTSRPG
ncbi:HCNGP-like protein-domain-containing protein [Aspergillus californicus]